MTVPDTYTPMDDDWELPTAEEIFREGYDFQGWYTNADFEGKPVKVLEKGSYGDKTFYAKWTLIYDKIREFGSYVSKLEIGNITMSDRTTIQKARALYDSMTEAEKEDGACKLYYSTLVAAEEELHELEESMDAAEVVISLIDNLGDSITLEQQEVIEEARAEYDALTDEEKELITNYEKLVEAEATLEILVLDKETAEAVKEQIKNIGEVTLESETAILEARMAYNDLALGQIIVGLYQRLLRGCSGRCRGGPDCPSRAGRANRQCAGTDCTDTGRVKPGRRQLPVGGTGESGLYCTSQRRKRHDRPAGSGSHGRSVECSV